MDLDELKGQLSGLMSFPVTPFDSAGAVDLPRFRKHVRYQLETGVNALFVACGTGEMFSLGSDEHKLVVRAAVDEASGEKPIVAGVGYGASVASSMALAAEEAGADAVLVLPPYLVKSEQAGLFAHYEHIARSVSIGIIPYQRDNAIIAADTAARLAAIPNVVAIKDGAGSTDNVVRMRIATDGKLPLMNGMPTAELSSYAYRACGVDSYSSAVLNFVPEVALAFYEAFRNNDTQATDKLLEGFFAPLVELRDEVAGYAVALVKAGVSLRHESVGDVRPPLVPPTDAHKERLGQIIHQGLELVGATEGPIARRNDGGGTG